MITIDYQNRKPIYEQIADRVEAMILSGAVKPQTQLPSIRSLAVELSINPNTIQKAYACLEQEGLIYPVKGRGNFVCQLSDMEERRRDACYKMLKNLVEEGKQLGITREEMVDYVRHLYGGDER